MDIIVSCNIFQKGDKTILSRKNKVRFKRVDGEIQFWELATCVKEYFKGEDCAIRKNIELFIPLRNKLEHKFLPELDANIFAECQALLLNFDKIVEKEFGEDYCLRESLSFALQLFPSSRTLAMGIKMSKDAQKITRFIDKYRASISTDIMQSGEYSFKAFLIQVANHKSVDALPVQFFPYDKLTDDEKKKVERIAGLIKEKHIPVVNKGTLKPATVIQQVQERLGNPKIIRGKNKLINLIPILIRGVGKNMKFVQKGIQITLKKQSQNTVYMMNLIIVIYIQKNGLSF